MSHQRWPSGDKHQQKSDRQIFCGGLSGENSGRCEKKPPFPEFPVNFSLDSACFAGRKVQAEKGLGKFKEVQTDETGEGNTLKQKSFET